MNSGVQVPDGWDVRRLKECIKKDMPGEWGTPANGDENDIFVLRSTNFTNSGKIDYSKIVKRNIPAKKLAKKVLVTGDFLLEKSGGSPKQPVGRVVYFNNKKKFLFSNFIQRISPADNCDSKYLFYKFLREYQNGLVLKFQQQTTGIINFQLSEYLLIKTPLPPLPEQKKIAQILTSVDDVIEKTESQISKLQDLKKGMMTELLTKGIGHTEFKDSPVGRIPKGWDFLTLEQIAKLIKPGPFGSSITKAMYVESGYKVYGQEQVISGDISIGDYYIDEEKFNELSAFEIIRRDVLVSLVGTFGQVLVVPDIFEAGIINPRLLILRFDELFVSSQFIKFQLLSDIVGNQLRKFQQGGTMGVLSAGTVKPVKVSVPPIIEQKEIASILTSIDTNIESKQRKLSQTKSLKKALMNDLLTGKVRVKTTSTTN